MPEEIRSKERVAPAPQQHGAGVPPKKRASGARPPAKKRPSIFRDPWVRRAGFVAVGLVILYLVFVISAILVGVLASDQPKTAAERDLTVYKKMIDAGSVEEKYWAGYADALVDLGQYGRAQEVLDQAEEVGVADVRVRLLYVVQTQLFYDTEKYESAIETGREGMKLLSDQRDADQKALAGGGDPTSLTATGLPDSYWALLSLIAQSYEKLGQDEDVLEALNFYIDNEPFASDMLEWRGDVYSRMGKSAEALADWNQAVRFVGTQEDIDRLQGKIDGAE